MFSVMKSQIVTHERKFGMSFKTDERKFISRIISIYNDSFILGMKTNGSLKERNEHCSVVRHHTSPGESGAGWIRTPGETNPAVNIDRTGHSDKLRRRRAELSTPRTSRGKVGVNYYF